jgi:hypothetical protein
VTRYYVMSDAVDDLMFETDSLVEARREIRRMAELPADQGDPRYFPLSIQKDAPRSPYRRRLAIVQTHTLTGFTRHNPPIMVRENGETPR